MKRKEEKERASKEFAKKNPYIYYSDLEDGDYDDADAVYDFKAPAIIFAKGAEWADKTMIDKVCEWIKQHLYDEAYLFRDNEGTWVDTDLVVNDLKKAMNE